MSFLQQNLLWKFVFEENYYMLNILSLICYFRYVLSLFLSPDDSNWPLSFKSLLASFCIHFVFIFLWKTYTCGNSFVILIINA